MKTTNDRFEQLELESNDLDMIAGGAVVFGRAPQPEPGVYVSQARQSLGDGRPSTMPLGADGLYAGVQNNQLFGLPLTDVRAFPRPRRFDPLRSSRGSKEGSFMHRVARFTFALFRGRRLGFSATVLTTVATVAIVSSVARADNAQYDRLVAHELDTFTGAFLGRRVSDAELEILTDEFLRCTPQPHMSRKQIQDLARTFGSYAPVLRKDPDGPQAVLVRQRLIAANYFVPNMQNTLTLRLLQEPDPVRIADARSKQVMTESAVVALANIVKFSETTAEPRHQQLSRAAIEKVVAALDRRYGNHRNASRLPRFLGEAAAFWAGVQREWPRLSREEKRLTRAYAARLSNMKLPGDLYARLWGYNRDEADTRLQAERTRDAVNEASAAITQIYGMQAVNNALWH